MPPASREAQLRSMSSHLVVFLPDGICLEAETGQTILDAARSAEVAIDSSCGGLGACGRCKVVVTLGQPSGDQGDFLLQAELEQGVVLACRATIEDDLVVEVPPPSQRGEIRILTSHADLNKVVCENTGALTRCLPVVMIPPEREREVSDESRLLAGLAGNCPTDGVLSLDLPALQRLPLVARDEDWKVNALVADFGDRPRVIAVEPPGSRTAYGLAVDVGTTTVVVHLIDLMTGGLVHTCASLNEQVTYGEDVISRIIHTQEYPDGLEQLRAKALATINRCLLRAVEELGLDRESVVAASLAGNTVMTHLLLGIDPAAIRREPYVPAVTRVPVLRAAEVQLNIHPQAPVYLSPCVSSYVGGDITAGVLTTGMAESSRLTLFIDMGTNGEIVLGNREWLICCSCSVGPAFEGSGIEHGMFATVGAMERIRYRPETDEVAYATIGEAKPRGLCGSGLVDALATLLRTGVIDRAGKINLGFPSQRVRVRNDRPEFVLVWGESIGLASDITLDENAIENLIRSKSAVYAGIETLLDSLGLTLEAVAQVLVAGGFGNYLDVDSAVTIGLLPDLARDRIRFVGNASVAGARLALLSRPSRDALEEIAQRMTNTELSMTVGYMDRYVAGLFLPHTDLNRFPTVAAELRVRT